MSGLASVANPLDPNARAIQVFYVTQNGNLAMAFRSGGEDTAKESRYFPKSDDYKGNIWSPSHLAAGYYQGSQFVVGLTRPKPAGADTWKTGDKPDSLNISIVSPVYKPLVTGLEIKNTSLTLTSNAHLASIFYLRGADAPSTRLHEFNLRTGVPGPEINCQNISEASALAGYIQDGVKYVIFQNQQNGLHEYSSETEQYPNMQILTEAAANATLAVTYVEPKKAVYLYYRSKGSKLIRMTKKDGQWGGTKQMRTAQGNVGATSQLAVVHSNNINHVFWVAENDPDNEPIHFRDTKLDD